MLVVVLSILMSTTEAVPVTVVNNSLLDGQRSLGNSTGSVSCTRGGIEIQTNGITKYEACAEDYCVLRVNPPSLETVKFPPEVTLHNHKVTWKATNGKEVRTTETECPATPFCENVDCTFCTAVVFNPECFPRTAIAVVATYVYLLIAIFYAICYVPMVIGRPFRVVGNVIILLVRFWMYVLSKIVSVIKKCCRRQERTARQRRILKSLSTTMVIVIFGTIVSLVQACQDVNIFEHKMTTCTTSTDREVCKVRVSEILKLNAFHQEGCIRLVKDNSSILEIRLNWAGVVLSCDKETIMYTRNSQQRVIDSKRCPHTGSCTGTKCEDVNTTSLIPELEKGNQYPGVTSCVESCGGPGCDCFYFSSGCLFYRIYAVPKDNSVYEIFKCAMWKEELKLSIQVKSSRDKQPRNYIAMLSPNKPIDIAGMMLTLSSITVPPATTLHSDFITDGTDVSLWNPASHLPALQCDTHQEAAELKCQVHPNCKCQPAETKFNCICEDEDVSTQFQGVQNRLPVHRPWITFYQDPVKRDNVKAKIESMSTTEIIVNINDNIDTTIKQVTDGTCRIKDTVVNGCYSCQSGAVATVRCITDTQEPTSAEVVCDADTFTVPCSRLGVDYEIRFHSEQAQVRRQCSTKCGATSTHFEVTGILKWTKTLHAAAVRVLRGESEVKDEVVLPDISHMMDVFSHWIKEALIAALVVAATLLVTYLVVTTFALRLIAGLWRTFFRGLLVCCQLLAHIAAGRFRGNRQFNDSSKAPEKEL